ncbi:MAG: acyl-CoA/acyl-ACP dehydrogenase [Planctomycetes bacterium]|nr:acyl-CoA/acyl-ACP dehydrogenase [Planctomycetota bacterium]
MTESDPVLSAAEDIASGVVAAQAPETDSRGAFPERSISALAEAGLLGVLSDRSVGGLGQGLGTAVRVVERMARECGSTAMVLTMHYCGTAVVEKYGDEATRRALASGARLTTLAFSESGSRSHFWAPTSTATAHGDEVALDARKSWVTSANRATDYVWSSRPVAAEGASTLWLVGAKAAGIAPGTGFDGLGLRGNDSTPVRAEGARVSMAQRLGADGQGFAIMMETVLPTFALLISAGSIGLMAGACQRAIAHVTGTSFEHLGETLASLPTIRAQVARMQVGVDSARATLDAAVAAIAAGREDAMLRVLEAKAAAGETALAVVDGAMRVCGGAAFRKEVGVDRYFRDARAANVMAPTTDQLYDFIGRAVCGLPLFE